MLAHYLNLIEFTLTAHALFFIELIVCLIILASLLFFRRKTAALSTPLVMQNKENNIKKSFTIITSRDIKAIAGENVLSTQLDLARAYIEIGKKSLAKKILDHVTRHGNVDQIRIAQHLMMDL